MKSYEERIFKIIMIGAAIIILGVLIYIIGTIFYRGLPALTWEMITKVPGGGFYLGKEGGVLNAIAGSVYIIFGAIAISLVISVPLVMYINFYLPAKSMFSNIITILSRYSFRSSIYRLWGIWICTYGISWNKGFPFGRHYHRCNAYYANNDAIA